MRKYFKFSITKEGKGRQAHWVVHATYESFLILDGKYKWCLIKAIEGQKYTHNPELIMAISELVGKSIRSLDMVPTRITVIEEGVSRQVILKTTWENAGKFCYEDTGDEVGSVFFT